MINWHFISEAIQHYTSRGFVYIDVPWAVSHESESVTKPVGKRSYPFEDKCLVASGEQGFIELGRPVGRFVTCTPCFRDEGGHCDRYTRPYFVKVELYTKPVNSWSVINMYSTAATLFRQLGLPNPEVVTTVDGVDLIDSVTGVELGSYGVRGDFAYGTGLAEPRLSEVLLAHRRT